jgi:methylmalonyl-CoA mutase
MTDALPDFASLFPAVGEPEWRARVDGVLKGADFARKLVARTHDGLEIQPLHQARADAALVVGANAGRPWATAARVDHPDAESAARQAVEDLEGGADMLALFCPASVSARGHGLSCETVSDLDESLAGVDLELIRLRLDAAPADGSQAVEIGALAVAALAERRKLDPARLRIDFGLDPLTSLIAGGDAPWDWAAMGGRLARTAAALKGRGFAGPFLMVDMRPFHDAGASEGQELAAALAAGVLYLRALEAHGAPLSEAFRAISFMAPLDADQFMGIAKLRALRKLWARVAQACGVSPEPAAIHAETSWRMLTRRDPHVNILRNTIAAFAAGVGGADTLTVLPFTQALGLPDAMARRLARNTSIVLQEEASLWRVADPAAGSGGVEALTDALAAKAWSLFQEIEDEGGLLVSLALGTLNARIAATAAARRKAVAARKEPITGVSEFANLTETPPAVLTVGPVRRRARKARAQVKHGAAANDIIAALVAGASLADAAPAPDGRLRVSPLIPQRIAEPFEALRDRADAMLKRRRRRPMVVLVTLGPLADHGPRLGFMRNLLEAAGIDVLVAPLSAQPGAADAQAALLCLVGSDAAYAGEGAKAARSLRAKGRTLWLAGRPGDLEEALRKAGVKRFVFAGADMVETLGEALALAGA